jgi:hypothetical protein
MPTSRIIVKSRASFFKKLRFIKNRQEHLVFVQADRRATIPASSARQKNALFPDRPTDLAQLRQHAIELDRSAKFERGSGSLRTGDG